MVTKANPTELFDVEYKGLSTDEKPTDCAANSLFLELDTGKFYYFDGEDWNELGTGGGGGGGDVLYDGSATFVVSSTPQGDISMLTDGIEFTRMPEDGEDVYLYINDQQIGDMSNWVYNGSDNYSAMLMDGETPLGAIQYGYSDRWLANIILADTSIVGEKTVEIRKTAK